MDVSDGLAKDLDRLLRASGVAGSLSTGSVPLSDPARRVLARNPQRLADFITSGDDYEVLATVAPGRAQAFAAAAAKTEISVARIGTVGPPNSGAPGAPALTVIGADGGPLQLPERTGWDHF
jgi:thiamine-monophosphate kinase